MSDLPQAYDWRKRNIKRDNFATFAELDNACAEARLILRRKSSTIDRVRRAADILNMAVRTLRSWHSSRVDELRYADATVLSLRTQMLKR